MVDPHEGRSASDEQGVAFPAVDGRRSTSATGKGVFAAAAGAVDSALADAVTDEPAWHKGYVTHVRRVLEAGLDDADSALTIARAGIGAVHERFEFASEDETVPIATALDRPDTNPLRTVFVDGLAPLPTADFAVPYRGAMLRGDALHRQLDRWVGDGVVEPSFAEAVRAVMANPDWRDLSDLRIACLGAAAELGPLAHLCGWGAHVLPVELPDPRLWKRVLAAVHAGCGRASIPVRRRVDASNDAALAAAAGADLVRELPAIAAWLDKASGPLVVANHAYADGAAHVRVAVAADALLAHLADADRVAAAAFLATPTDVFAAPEDAVAESQRRFAERARLARLPQGALSALSGGRLFAPNYEETFTTAEGVRFGVADTLLPQQGPNYVLAKRIQRWRALIGAAEGMAVSANVCAPTRTRSVMANRLLATAYDGAAPFGAEIFDPPTSTTLMAALLVHDLRNSESAGAPGRTLAHPELLFAEAANHGGLWRIPFAPRSALPFAVGLGALPGRR